MRAYVRTSRRTGVSFNPLWLLVLWPLAILAVPIACLLSDRFTIPAKMLIVFTFVAVLAYSYRP